MSLLETLLDPKRRAKAKADQQKQRELRGHQLASHPAIAAFRYGLARINLIYSLPDDIPLSTFQMHQLGEGLALTGQFAEAAKAARSGPDHDHYLTMASAVESIGSHRCMCPALRVVRVPGNAKGRSEPNRILIHQVSLDGVTITDIFRCKTCGVLSST